MFTLKISTANAAFDDETLELSRILRDVARRLDRGDRIGGLRDINGNVVGSFNLTGKRRED